jgi:hypothetical protein
MGKLIKEVIELKTIINEKKISPGIAARFIECSEREVYRWVQGVVTPSMLYRKAIRRGLRRIRNNL